MDAPPTRAPKRPALAMGRLHPWIVSVLCLLVVGCGEEPPSTPPAPAPAETKRVVIDVPTSALAGAAIVFPCEQPRLTPSRGWERVDAGGWSQRQRGAYRWRCQQPEGQGDLEITPEAPTAVEWEALEETISIGRSLHIRAWQTDRFSNRVGAPLTLTPTPADAVRVEGERLRFLTPGAVTLSAKSAAGDVIAEKKIRVDSGPPLVHIEAPARGVVIDRRSHQEIVLRGRVTDDSPSIDLQVNGQSVQVQPDGRFRFTLRPRRDGLQVFRYQATDELSQVTIGAHAVLFGLPRAGGRPLRNAARVHFPKSFLDDDDSIMDDLAHAAEVMLSSLKVPDSNILIPCDGNIKLSNVHWEPGKVSIKPYDGGLTLGVALKEIHVDFAGKACACAFGKKMGCAAFSGDVKTANVDASVGALLGGKHPTSITIDDVDLSIAPLTIHWDIWSGALNWFVDLFEETVRDFLIEAIKLALSQRIHADLGTLLQQVVPAQSILIPAPIDALIQLRANIEEFHAKDQGLTIDIGLELLDAPQEGPAPKGLHTLQTSIGAGLPTLPADRVAIAVALDALNGAVFDLYRRGAFSGVMIEWDELGLRAPTGISDVTLFAHLPPVLLPGKKTGQLELAVGDLQIKTRTPVGDIEVFVSFVAPMHIAFDAKKNDVIFSLLSDGLEVYIAPASIEDARTLSASLVDLEAITRRAIQASLIGKEIRLAVPLIDLSQIETVRSFKDKTLGLSNASLTITPEGYIIATTQVEGSP